MGTMPRISDAEFKQRIQRTQQKMKEQGLDLLLAYANESEPQHVRYYSDYWPAFELAAVLIPVEGEAYLLIGPESETYARSRSRLPNVRRILVLRESSEPDYPGAQLDTFASVVQEIPGCEHFRKAGIAGYSLIPKIVYDEFAASLATVGITDICRADDLANSLRMIKTPDEIACLKYAYEIAGYAMDKVMEQIKPGMTENQVKGIALEAMYSRGAEGEGYPFWVLTGTGSNQAVSKVRNKVIQQGEIVQVQVSARYEGYVSTMGRPVVVGEPTQYQRNLIEAGYKVQAAILNASKPGVPAKTISELHRKMLTELGFADHILYGPVHGTGLVENEHPWIEDTSEYQLQEGMVFCTCLYLGNDEKEVGIRVEDGYVITKDGAQLLTDYPRKMFQI